jgi:hypothetical protein
MKDKNDIYKFADNNSETKIITELNVIMQRSENRLCGSFDLCAEIFIDEGTIWSEKIGQLEVLRAEVCAENVVDFHKVIKIVEALSLRK